MSQYFPGTIDPTTTSGTALASLLTSWAAALNTTNSGASEPSYKVNGTLWLDTTTGTAYALKIYDGTQWITAFTYNPSTHAAPGYKIKRVRTFTASATYTPTDGNVKALIVNVQGGGGGGGGAGVCTSTQAACGGGGGGGTFAQALIVSGFSSVSMTIGAGGAGGTGGTGNGTTGGDTSFGSLVVAPGGAGGQAVAAGTVSTIGGGGGQGGAVPTFSGAGTTEMQRKHGEPGTTAIRLGGTTAIGGSGGNSLFGAGGFEGAAISTSGGFAGAAGLGHGSGGAGAVNVNDAAQTGGNGQAGKIVVWEME